MRTSREHHDATRAWRATLPQRTPEDSDINVLKQYYEDLNGLFRGKTGVIFVLGTCMYDPRVRHGETIGYVRFLAPHAGSYFTAFDDLMTFSFAEKGLTKTLDMEFATYPPPFDETLRFTTQVKKNQVSPERLEISTAATFYSLKTGQPVAWGKAIYVQNTATRKIQIGTVDLDEQWRLTAPFRLRGANPKDPNMDFMLHAPVNMPTSAPEPFWWKKNELSVPEMRPNCFAGRMDIRSLFSSKQEEVFAVVFPHLNSEGFPGMMHGGAASCALLEVLQCAVKDVGISMYAVRFRRPVPVGKFFVVEWKRWEEVWRGEMLDLERNVMQEAVVTRASLEVDKIDSLLVGNILEAPRL
jgi:hypothetical protein